MEMWEEPSPFSRPLPDFITHSSEPEEGGHDVTLQQHLVRSDDIPRAGIVDASYKDHSTG